MKIHLTRRRTLKLMAASVAASGVPGTWVLGATGAEVEYRRLGRTDLEASVVGFGSLSIGLASTGQQRVSQLLNEALNRGLNMIDTAECYGHPDRNHAETLMQARQSGKIRFLAYSGSGERVRYAIETNDYDVVQLTLNVFEQNAIDDLLPLTKERDIGVVVKRPIGNAVWRFRERPEWEWYAEYWDLIEPLDFPFFEDDALTDPGPEGTAGMALRFVTSTPGVHTAIVGTTSPGRWTQNNSNVSVGPLPAKQYQAIRTNWRSLPPEQRGLG